MFSLKGYEVELYEGHGAGVRCLAFVPNQGILVSIDDKNEVAVWNMKQLDQEPIRVQIPVDEMSKKSANSISTLLYAPTTLSSEPENHKNVFIAMSDGTLFVFDWHLAQFSPVVITYGQIFHHPKGDCISDVKIHPIKMHRVLIAYEETAVVVYSLNKDRDI